MKKNIGIVEVIDLIMKMMSFSQRAQNVVE